MTKIMKKLVVLAVMMTALVLASCSNITMSNNNATGLASQLTNWEIYALGHYNWNDDEHKRLELYSTILGYDYSAHILDGPFEIDYISEKAGEQQEDTYWREKFLFTAIKNGKKYYPTFYEYEPGVFMMILWDDKGTAMNDITKYTGEETN